MENQGQDIKPKSSIFHFGKGLKEDVLRRLPFYFSDFKDGIIGPKTIQKVISTTIFLFVAVILPATATGVLNDKFTHGNISVYQVIIGQVLGGLLFTFLAGQPLVVISTTLVVALFNKVIYSWSEFLDMDFLAFHGATGLWTGFFMLIYSLSNVAELMKLTSRSIKEIFTCFVVVAFVKSAISSRARDFEDNYWCEATDSSNNATMGLSMRNEGCNPQESIIGLLLMLSVLWLGRTLFGIRFSRLFNAKIRDLISSYALAIAVITCSLIGSLAFGQGQLKTFPYNEKQQEAFKIINLSSLSITAIFTAMGLGFCLSLLLFMSQTINTAIVDSPENKLKKGSAYHWDILVIGLINAILGIFGLPFMHAILPQGSLNLRGLADIQDQGQVSFVRETRLTTLFCNLLIGLSLLIMSKALEFVPISIFDGLFLYLGVAALCNTDLYQRLLLLISETRGFSMDYVKSVPLWVIHSFTFIQMIQLAILCGFGFNAMPEVRMLFPVVIFSLSFFRLKCLGLIFRKDYLQDLD